MSAIDLWSQRTPDLWIRYSIASRVIASVYRASDGYWYCEGQGLPYDVVVGTYPTRDAAIRATRLP